MDYTKRGQGKIRLQGMEYWRSQKTGELKKIVGMADKALRYGFKFMDGDKTIEEIQTVLRERN